MTENTQFTDDYFINLTMDYDKRDDAIYPKWAVWCALSEDRYYIDGKDGHFYTHVRTDEEIAIERKRRELIEFVNEQDRELDNEGHPTESWMEYERYMHELAMNTENILSVEPKTYVEWMHDKNLSKEESKA